MLDRIIKQFEDIIEKNELSAEEVLYVLRRLETDAQTVYTMQVLSEQTRMAMEAENGFGEIDGKTQPDRGGSGSSDKIGEAKATETGQDKETDKQDS